MILQENIDKLREMLQDASRVVVLSHKNPDGDALGSSLALFHYLRSLGQEVKVIYPNAFPEFFNWMPGASETLLFENDAELATEAVANASLVFCLDFNTLSRIGDLGCCVSSSTARKVLVDHHPDPSPDFSIAISHTAACSTSELVYEIIVGLSGLDGLSLEMAQCIYTGMMTDTGAFAYASTRKDIYLIIAELLGKGVDKDWIYRKVFYNYTLSRMRLSGYVLYDKLKLYNKYNAALITLTHSELMRFYAAKGDTEGLVNQPLQIKGVRFSCFLREEVPGKINVSLRSVDDFPCNEVAMRFFNGGGHKNASGGELHCTMGAAVEQFKKALQCFKQELTE